MSLFNPGPPADSDRLRGLVRVNSRWFGWTTDRHATVFEGLLSRLVLDAGPDTAWLQRPRAHTPIVEPDTEHWEPEAWVKGADACDNIKKIGADLKKIGEDLKASLAPATPGKPDPAPLSTCNCRIFLDRARMLSLSDPTATTRQGDKNAYATIEWRFHRVKEWDFLYVTIAVWTHWPSGPTLGPSRPPDLPDAQLGWKDAEAWLGQQPGTRDLFWGILDEQTRDHGPRMTPLTIGSQVYDPPHFLIAATSTEAHTFGLDWLDLDTPGRRRLVRRLSTKALHLDNANSDVIAASVIADALVLRTIDESGDRHVPRYLILPQAFLHAASTEDIVPLGAEGERRMDDLIVDLVDVESKVAVFLWDIGTDTALYSNHVDVYAYVGERAAALFDAIAFMLPVARGRWLQRVHQMIDLIQQTLLQGVADLADVIKNLQRLEDDVSEASKQQLLHCIGRLHEQTAPGHAGISHSITTQGYFERAKLDVSEALARGHRCKSRNDELLDAIALAIDERRAREGDRLAKLSVAFTAAITMVALLSATDLLWRRNVASTGMNPGLLVVGVGVGMIVLFVLAFAGWAIYRSSRGWLLTTREYKPRFERLRQFLRAASSDALRRFTQELEDRERRSEQPAAGADWNWNELDDSLSECLAGLIDELFPGIGPGTIWDWREDMAPFGYRLRDPGDVYPNEDIKVMESRVEEWSLQTLLITERPRMLWIGKLPKLTCLYRFCLHEVRIAGLRAETGVAHAGDSSVGSDEFLIALRSAGYRTSQAEAIEKWGCQQKGRPARDVFSDLVEVGLRTMSGADAESARERQEVVDRLGGMMKKPDQKIEPSHNHAESSR